MQKGSYSALLVVLLGMECGRELPAPQGQTIEIEPAPSCWWKTLPSRFAEPSKDESMH